MNTSRRARQTSSQVTERFRTCVMCLLGVANVPQEIQHEVEAAVSEKHDVVRLQIGLCSLLDLSRRGRRRGGMGLVKAPKKAIVERGGGGEREKEDTETEMERAPTGIEAVVERWMHLKRG